jgi:hypothetical protein
MEPCGLQDIMDFWMDNGKLANRCGCNGSCCDEDAPRVHVREVEGDHCARHARVMGTVAQGWVVLNTREETASYPSGAEWEVSCISTHEAIEFAM